MKIIIGGGSGLIGRALIPVLQRAGHEVSILSRDKDVKGLDVRVYTWDIWEERIEEGALGDVDVIINLAGAGVADKRWSEKRKAVIERSRVGSNNLLFKQVRDVETHRVKKFISASAIGIYGVRGNKELTENSTHGDPDNFLVKTCEKWESAAFQFEDLGITTCVVRTGLVLDYEEGMLPQLLMPAKFGVYPYFGKGDQYFSWIHIADIVDIYLWLVQNLEYKGVYNATAPNPVTNKEFMTTLKEVKSGPGFSFPIPEFVLKTAMGEMAKSVTSGAKVIPKKLLREGFEFDFPDVQSALEHLLKMKVYR